jgi:hypothetical protein
MPDPANPSYYQKTAYKYDPFEGNFISPNMTFTIGAEVGSTINIAIQLETGGSPEYQNCWLTCYMSSTPDGLTPTALATSWAIGTNGTKLWDIIAHESGVFVCNSAGKFDVNLVDTGGSGDVFYFCILLPDGTIAISPKITF